MDANRLMEWDGLHVESSLIELRGMCFFARHGVLPEERLLGNTFVVDVVMEADIRQAIVSDDLGATVNYAEAYEIIRQEMDIPSQLLEHVCGRIAAALLGRFGELQRVRVCVAKRNPPIAGADCKESAVSLTCGRG